MSVLFVCCCFSWCVNSTYMYSHVYFLHLTLFTVSFMLSIELSRNYQFILVHKLCTSSLYILHRLSSKPCSKHILAHVCPFLIYIYMSFYFNFTNCLSSMNSPHLRYVRPIALFHHSPPFQTLRLYLLGYSCFSMNHFFNYEKLVNVNSRS